MAGRGKKGAVSMALIAMEKVGVPAGRDRREGRGEVFDVEIDQTRDKLVEFGPFGRVAADRRNSGWCRGWSEEGETSLGKLLGLVPEGLLGFKNESLSVTLQSLMFR